MKNLFVVSIALGILSGTSLTTNAQQSVRFIDGIDLSNNAVGLAATPQSADIARLTIAKPGITFKASAAAMATEACTKLQFKYAQLMDREIEFITNNSLFTFIDEWWVYVTVMAVLQNRVLIAVHLPDCYWELFLDCIYQEQRRCNMICARS